MAYVRLALAFGLEARLAFSEASRLGTGGGHCVPEVFCHELDRWVMVDPDSDTHPTHRGEPIGVMDLHTLATSGCGCEVEIVPGAPGLRRKPSRAAWRETRESPGKAHPNCHLIQTLKTPILADDIHEVIQKLRLNQGRRHPREALRRLRRTRQIGWVRVGKIILYPADEIDKFVETRRGQPGRAVRRQQY